VNALRAALAEFVDYAGLFPPAGLDLATTVANHDRYARSPDRWMLGRLVLPLAGLDQVPELLRSHDREEGGRHGGREWQISLLVTPREAPGEVHSAIARFHESEATAGVKVTALEATLSSPEAVPALAGLGGRTLERFVEIPLDDGRDAWLDAIAAAGCRAKVRTGGVTADRVPSATSLAACLHACAARGLAGKATAGLHHPLRNAYRLTYEPDSPSGVMHGFGNLLVAALTIRAGGNEGDAVRALEAMDPRRFEVSADAITWEGQRFGAGACEDTRAFLLRSVGSCSFEEPVAELRALGWWPD
jgi:hypothetical protein